MTVGRIFLRGYSRDTPYTGGSVKSSGRRRTNGRRAGGGPLFPCHRPSLRRPPLKTRPLTTAPTFPAAAKMEGDSSPPPPRKTLVATETTPSTARRRWRRRRRLQSMSSIQYSRPSIIPGTELKSSIYREFQLPWGKRGKQFCWKKIEKILM